MGTRRFAWWIGSFLLILGAGSSESPAISRQFVLEMLTERFVGTPALEDVHFGFDGSRIEADAVSSLEADVRVLKRIAPARVLLEGHTDEWGSEEYNLRLGERRAWAVRNEFTKRGLNQVPIATISYGKARPLCLEHHRVCWAENRRVHLQVSANEPGFTGPPRLQPSGEPPLLAACVHRGRG